MRVLTTLPQEDLRRVPDAAREAEQAGFDGLITLENRNDPFLALGVAAVATEKIVLGTAVAIAFPRSPMVVANMSWDLQIASRGRFVLGLGPQIRPHNEKRFSVPWTAPIARLREYVLALRAIWTAWEKCEKLRFEGEHYTFTLMTPNFVPPSMSLPMTPITLAAVGPKALRLAGEVADGVRLHPFCTRRYLEEVVLSRLREGSHQEQPQLGALRGVRRRLHRHRTGLRRGRQHVRVGSNAHRLLRFDPKLLAGAGIKRTGRSWPQAECSFEAGKMGGDDELDQR